MKDLVRSVAFVAYPVTDMQRARAFYEGALGLQPGANWDDAWVEYDLGESALAITDTLAHLKPGAGGAVMAIEVSDFDAVLQRLAERSVDFFTGPFDSPACRGCSIEDPDGNEVILHQRR